MKGINPKDNHANQQNANKGTTGTNRQYDQNQGNRGKQMNPNQLGKMSVTSNKGQAKAYSSASSKSEGKGNSRSITSKP